MENLDQNKTLNNQNTQTSSENLYQIPKQDILIQENPGFQKSTNAKTSLKRKGLGRSLFLIFGIVAVIALGYLVFTTYRESQFFTQETISDVSVTTQDSSDNVSDTALSQSVNTTIVTAEGVVPSCEGPGVRVLYPNGGEVVRPGDDLVLDWEICGISPSLIEKVALSYTGVDSQDSGSVNIFCSDAPVSIQDETKLVWSVPAYVEQGSESCLQQKEVDFSNPYKYKLQIVYANQQYQDLSDEFFTIDTRDYVYQPAVFSDYVVDVDPTFTRASGLLQDSTYQILQEKIQPSFFTTPPTFANYYRIYALSCGTGCFVGRFLIDLRDGKAYQTPMFSEDSAMVFIDPASRLLIIEVSSDETIEYQNMDTLVSWYEFKEEEKDFVILDTKLCNVSGTGTSKVYQDCVQP